jgi:Flp pilus assembly protein TadD
LIAALLLGVALAAETAPPSPDWSDKSERIAAQLDVIEALLDSGVPEKALAAVSEVRAQGAKDGRLDVLQGRALHATGMHAEARQVLEAHVKKAPRDADGWAALGVVLADGGDLPGSLAALSRAERLSPKDPAVLNNLGYARLANGEAEAAVGLFRRSLGQDPAQPRTRNNLGFALAREEHDSEALEAFRGAGSEADARYNLGVACVLRGDRACALAQFHAALEATPGHPAATTALASLLEASP